ncbi:excinuclease ABC subunit UvrC [Methanosphaera sp. ISO3-F5]|uniref:excinuclease ABC subunit UvrC n=1 Tax=Methanosphaera sp. ISO3-F5 TaxID=1452353 RepID=UPI002B25FC7B|nr:excinuclease ABC subunit UvrC [Methanosphaera sp. ISO3-F5]WQH63366.1 excinuclease ABC subunit UvrC [Methanosphaera sp. ISO3-F5]
MSMKITSPEELPQKPGVYIMHNSDDEIIYVGKAKKLKNRVQSYFREEDKLDRPKTQVLMKHFSYLEYILTDTEKEALILEANLIKRHKPRYNISLKDGKQYPYIKITNEEFPRIHITRRLLNDGASYYGPYTDATNARGFIDFINKNFKIRTCKHMDGPCLNYQIKQCSAPCVNYITQEEYNKNIRRVKLLLMGRYKTILKQLKKEMNKYSKNMEFEKAAIIRDQIENIQVTLEKQNIQPTKDVDQDIIGIDHNDSEAAVVIISVRNGKTNKKDDIILKQINGFTDTEILTEFIKQYYSTAPAPDEIILEDSIEDEEIILEWLEEKQGHKIKIKVAEEGHYLTLIRIAKKNAHISLTENTKEEENPLLTLEQYLRLPKLPYHIEAFDISNISGIHAVASMVVFENAKPAKKMYRKFKMNTPGPNDFAMMKEVLTRRYSRIAPGYDEQKASSDSMYIKPDLVLIDGGKGQLGMAVEVFKSLGINDVPLVGLAKKFEELYVPGRSQPIILPRKSTALHLLQYVRDESHRFAITFHRQLRSKAFTKSILDEIPGVGKKRKQALLAHFENLDAIYDASYEEICEVEGINKKLAKTIYETLENDKNNKKKEI